MAAPANDSRVGATIIGGAIAERPSEAVAPTKGPLLLRARPVPTLLTLIGTGRRARIFKRSCLLAILAITYQCLGGQFFAFHFRSRFEHRSITATIQYVRYFGLEVARRAPTRGVRGDLDKCPAKPENPPS